MLSALSGFVGYFYCVSQRNFRKRAFYILKYPSSETPMFAGVADFRMQKYDSSGLPAGRQGFTNISYQFDKFVVKTLPGKRKEFKPLFKNIIQPQHYNANCNCGEPVKNKIEHMRQCMGNGKYTA